MSDVATVTVLEVIPQTQASRPNLVSVGTIIWLSSELMFFAALFAMYFTIRSVDKGLGQHWPMAHLDLTLASANTTVLLLSSVTCQLGVFAVERGQIKRTGSGGSLTRVSAGACVSGTSSRSSWGFTSSWARGTSTSP